MILAIAFLNPLLLGGLGLSVLPIVIHLLSRRQFKRIEWGATRFLLEAEKENRRRVRFEQWLLVALRCLAMALLALLISRPYVQPGIIASLLGGGGRVQRILVIDDSASLGFRTGPTSDFATVRDAAVRLLVWLKHGAGPDPVAVYLASRPDEPLLPLTPLNDTTLDELRTRIGKLSPTDLSARPRRVLDAIAGDLAETAASTRSDIYILSDFQRTEWMAFDSAAQSVFEPLKALPEDNTRVVLISAGADSRDNVAITDISLERAQTIAGLPVMVRATVANFSRQPLRDARLQLDVENAPLPPVNIEQAIEPGKAQAVAFEVMFPDEGHRLLSVSLASPDGLQIDDVRRVSARVKAALPVLLVNGQPSSDPLRDETHLLRSALSPPGPFSSGIRVHVIDPTELETADLRKFDCVFLCNVAALAEPAAALLERFVRGGGGLVITLGEEAGDAVDLNRTLFAGGAGVMPIAIDGLQRAPAGEGFQMVRTGEHPVTAIFPSGAALSEYVRFRAFYRCLEPVAPALASAPTSGPARPAATVLARFTDATQSPALIERPLGDGRCILFTSTVDLDWNDWARAADGSYVVTMLELANYAARRGVEKLAQIIGEPITLVVSTDEYGPIATVKSPAYPDVPATEVRLREAGGDDVSGVFDGPVAPRAGVYTVELTRLGQGAEARPVAVNVDSIESDLAAARSAELVAAISPIPAEFVRAADSFLESGEESRRELWPTLLLFLAAILMLEQTLAWRFGTPGRVTRRTIGR